MSAHAPTAVIRVIGCLLLMAAAVAPPSAIATPTPTPAATPSSASSPTTPSLCRQRSTVPASSNPLADLWGLLNHARTYRCADLGPGRCGRPSEAGGGLSYDEMVDAYVSSLTSNGPARGRTPGSVFLRLLGTGTESAPGFARYLDDRVFGVEAAWGVQESLNEYLAGQALLGKDRLLKGLNARFPGQRDPSDPDQLTLLDDSVDILTAAVVQGATYLRDAPELLRQGSDRFEDPTWVENTCAGEANGEVVESELQRLTDVAERSAEAENSWGKRKFFFENNVEVGRAEAAQAFKRSAQRTYLLTAVLASRQNRKQFKASNGDALKIQLKDADKVFQDIVSGFNPLSLRGDFVPAEPFEKLLGNFDLVLNGNSGAVKTEGDAQSLARQFDQDETALRTELRGQQQSNLSELSALTGLTLEDLKQFDVLTDEGKRKLREAAERNRLAGKGSLGLKSQEIELAQVDVDAANDQIEKIPEKIHAEERRSGRTVQVIEATGQRLGGLTVAQSVVNAAVSYLSNVAKAPLPSVGIAAGTLAAAGSLVNGFLEKEKTLTQYMQNAQLDAIGSEAAVRNLLLEEATADISLRRANQIVSQRVGELEATQLALETAISNFETARADSAAAYFSNPAYRLQLSRARKNADRAFEAAMVAAYRATQALEYEWADSFRNPIIRLDGLLPETIGDVEKYNPITDLASAFAMRSAGSPGSPEPSLGTFREALQLWDSKMRSLRSPATQNGYTTRLSLRNHLTPAGGNAAASRSAFAGLVGLSRVPGVNTTKDNLEIPFALQIGTQDYFPAQPNVKLEGIQVNLKSRPGTSLRESGARGNAAFVELVMLDVAQLRTFFAEYPTSDDFMMIDLEGARRYQQSKFYALTTASVDGFPAIAEYNTQLENRSPAVSRWIVRLDMSAGENRFLALENLDDIEIVFRYKFGRPRPLF